MSVRVGITRSLFFLIHIIYQEINWATSAVYTFYVGYTLNGWTLTIFVHIRPGIASGKCHLQYKEAGKI